jgi:hypothetical protein
MRTRIIFIDIDGVFHPTAAVADFTRGQQIGVYATANNLMRWNEHLAEMLEQHRDVMLVAHSNWRKEFNDGDIRGLMGPLKKYYHGVTNAEYSGRYESIRRMVERVQVDDYLILDDATQEFPANCPELAICDPELGISEPVVQSRVRQWLDATRPAAES